MTKLIEIPNEIPSEYSIEVKNKHMYTTIFNCYTKNHWFYFWFPTEISAGSREEAFKKFVNKHFSVTYKPVTKETNPEHFI